MQGGETVEVFGVEMVKGLGSIVLGNDFSRFMILKGLGIRVLQYWVPPRQLGWQKIS